MDRFSVNELLTHPDKDAALVEMARRLHTKEDAQQKARYDCLKRERLWLHTEFQTCAAQHRANLFLT